MKTTRSDQFLPHGQVSVPRKICVNCTIKRQEKTERLYPSEPLMRSNQDLEQRLEPKLNDVYKFNKNINNIE